jgi:hypothetical protein
MYGATSPNGTVNSMPERVMPTVQNLAQALRASWAPDTAVAPEAYTPENPARGQCVVSSLVVQDYYGGDLRRYRTNYHGHQEMHYCNILPDGTILDTTGSQYQTPVTLEILPVDLKGFASVRQKRLNDSEIQHQYTLLKQRVERYLHDQTKR